MLVVLLCYAVLCRTVWTVAINVEIEKLYLKNKILAPIKQANKTFWEEIMSPTSDTLASMVRLAENVN
jgi:hypothetical protein